MNTMMSGYQCLITANNGIEFNILFVKTQTP